MPIAEWRAPFSVLSVRSHHIANTGLNTFRA